MYDPTIGRWISQDPLGFKAGDSNLFRYVGNKPTTETDPSGMAPDGEPWALRRTTQLIFQGRDAEAIRVNEQFIHDSARDAPIMIPAALGAAVIGFALPAVAEAGAVGLPALAAAAKQLLRSAPTIARVASVTLIRDVPRLVAVVNGRVIAHATAGLSHAEFVRRFAIPDCAWVGTAIKDGQGFILGFNSATIMGNQRPAPQAILDALRAFFQ